jgi:hypothetical protein
MRYVDHHHHSRPRVTLHLIIVIITNNVSHGPLQAESDAAELIGELVPNLILGRWGDEC